MNTNYETMVVQCTNCNRDITLGETMWFTPYGYCCSLDCVLDTTGTIETVLEECFFEGEGSYD